MKTEEISYSDAIAELNTIVQRIESGEIDVDALGASVSRATQLIKICRDRLTRTEAEVNDALRQMDEDAPDPGEVIAGRSAGAMKDDEIDDVTDPFAEE